MKKVIGILAVTLLSITISCKDNKVQEEGTMHNEECKRNRMKDMNMPQVQNLPKEKLTKTAQKP